MTEQEWKGFVLAATRDLVIRDPHTGEEFRLDGGRELHLPFLRVAVESLIADAFERGKKAKNDELGNVFLQSILKRGKE